MPLIAALKRSSAVWIWLSCFITLCWCLGEQLEIEKIELGIQLIHAIVTQHPEQTYIVIDGLGECADADEQQDLMDSITAILTVSNAEGTKVYVLVTSLLEVPVVEKAHIVKVQAADEEIK